MEKQYVILKNDQAQSELKKGMKGYIHNYVRGANGTPYVVVVSDKVIDLVSFYNLEPCENFTDNLPECLQQSSETAFAIHSVSQQRELLLAFIEYYNIYCKGADELYESEVESFLEEKANNCGYPLGI
jgi:hypothetical protein